MGELLNVPGVTPDIFKQLCPRVGVRSDTFRILAEGRVTSTGAFAQIEVVVRDDGLDWVTLAHRELP